MTSLWLQFMKAASVLSRLGAFALSVVALALVTLTLSERDWMDGMSIYIVAISCVSILGALIPPFPNFVVDALFAVAWLMAAVFSFLILVIISKDLHLVDNLCSHWYNSFSSQHVMVLQKGHQMQSPAPNTKHSLPCAS